MFSKALLIRPPMSRVVPATVHFITDTEGHYPSFAQSVNQSKVVHFDARGRLDFKPSVKNPYFVFGGDLTDRAPGDVPLTEMLLDFKKRNSDRVFLLAGNREASKSRFFVELNPRHIRQRLLHGGVPFWLLSGPHQTPLDYLKKNMVEKNLPVDNFTDIESFVDTLTTESCQLIYVKWMLEQNLGCPHTFNYQRQYLAEKLKRSLHDVSDSDVLNCILEQNSPQGTMGEYLRHTQIAAIIPNSGILAVHGGFTPENIGRIPTMPAGAPIIRDVHSWIDQFNQWFKEEVIKWSQLTHDEMPLVLQPARSTLDTFSLRVPSEFRSIVTSAMIDAQRQYVHVPEVVSDYLSRGGINVVLTGHQPCGDHPVLLRSQDDRVVFLNGDVGYANSKANNMHDTRGLASHTTEIEIDEKQTVISIDANLFTGKRILNSLRIADGKVADDSYVGKLLPDHELVQCRLPNGYYRTIKQHGFTVQYQFRTKDELQSLFQRRVLTPHL